MTRRYIELTILHQRLHKRLRPYDSTDLNFLAHQYLSFDDPEIMVGNFIADTVRGNDIKAYPEAIQKGIWLHRHIDTYTDSHILVLETRKMLYPWFGKYAAVVQDVFYDHFLALDWEKYHKERLPAFAKHVYKTLGKFRPVMNTRAQRTLYYMELQGWLQNYALREGMDRSLKGLSSRAKFDSGMEDALPALDACFAPMKQHFDAFFPALITAVQTELIYNKE